MDVFAKVEKIAAVVEQQIRPLAQHRFEVLAVFMQVRGWTAKHCDAIFFKDRDCRQLCRIEIARRDNPGAAALQSEEQRDSLGLQMDAGADCLSCEGPGRSKLLPYCREKSTIPPHPVNPSFHGGLTLDLSRRGGDMRAP